MALSADRLPINPLDLSWVSLFNHHFLNTPPFVDTYIYSCTIHVFSLASLKRLWWCQFLQLKGRVKYALCAIPRPSFFTSYDESWFLYIPNCTVNWCKLHYIPDCNHLVAIGQTYSSPERRLFSHLRLVLSDCTARIYHISKERKVLASVLLDDLGSYISPYPVPAAAWSMEDPIKRKHEKRWR